MTYPIRKFSRKANTVVILAATAVAAFGMTFHFFGSSAVVPEPSRQFGFWVLSPVAVIDRIYLAFSGVRLIWQPLPMFFVLWLAYSALLLLIFHFINKGRKKMA